MPELPEVETIICGLEKKILLKKIIDIEIKDKKIFKSIGKKIVLIKNNSFKKISRRGKILIFHLFKKDLFLLIHLRMTGQLVYLEGKKIIVGGHSDKKEKNFLLEKYSRVIFYFEEGKLIFNDLRRFGIIQIVDKKELEKIENNYGAEPLDKKFTLNIFQNIIKNKKGNIKAFLLNQKFIAGIGNIYADEILFESKILPHRKLESLKEKEKEEIFKAIKKILKKAIKFRGTTFNDYVDSDGNKGNFLKLLKVYGRKGKKCLKCKNSFIKKEKIAGRGTSYCKKCQK